MKNREKLFEKQNKALRDPQEILSAPLHYAGIETSSLEFVAGRSFASLLDKLGITLIITREYEHLVMALSAGKKLRQSFISLPHPSGVAVDRNNNAGYVARTHTAQSKSHLSAPHEPTTVLPGDHATKKSGINPVPLSSFNNTAPGT